MWGIECGRGRGPGREGSSRGGLRGRGGQSRGMTIAERIPGGRVLEHEKRGGRRGGG